MSSSQRGRVHRNFYFFITVIFPNSCSIALGSHVNQEGKKCEDRGGVNIDSEHQKQSYDIFLQRTNYNVDKENSTRYYHSIGCSQAIMQEVGREYVTAVFS